jgi:hypothetical protein
MDHAAIVEYGHLTHVRFRLRLALVHVFLLPSKFITTSGIVIADNSERNHHDMRLLFRDRTRDPTDTSSAQMSAFARSRECCRSTVESHSPL